MNERNVSKFFGIYFFCIFSLVAFGLFAYLCEPVIHPFSQVDLNELAEEYGYEIEYQADHHDDDVTIARFSNEDYVVDFEYSDSPIRFAVRSIRDIIEDSRSHDDPPRPPRDQYCFSDSNITPLFIALEENSR